ncbi:MAG: hypothetical protein ACFFBI_12365 [Promethearchaeota archaeon]
MKFNVKRELKTKIKPLILILLLMLSIALLMNIPGNPSQAEQGNEEVNASLPITPQYKYHYENNFECYTYTAVSASAAVLYNYTGWSQDATDETGLYLNYLNAWSPGAQFFMSGTLFVQSKKTFKKQADLTLGAYIDWHINLNVLVEANLDINSMEITLMIIGPAVQTELIRIYDPYLTSQQGRFYIPNFNQYIWSGSGTEGRIIFALNGNVDGTVELLVPYGGINLLLGFEGLRVIQEIKPKEPETEKRTLIFIHGWGYQKDSPEQWATFLLAQEFLDAYDDFILISYYYDCCAYKYTKNPQGEWVEVQTHYMNEYITDMTPIEEIALVIALYIIYDHLFIEDNVDIICHSMGGLVTRYMIKHYYTGIQDAYASVGEIFTIKNICILATPNHGVWLNWVFEFLVPPYSTQVIEMMAPSPFLTDLNNNNSEPGSEVPVSGININWFTYRSGLNNLAGVRHDGMVQVSSVPLAGAQVQNKGWYQLDHEMMRKNNMLKTVIFNDLFKPPEIINTIFDENTPGIIMKIEDLTLPPNYEAPGGKTLLNITFPSEDAGDIYSTSVNLYVSANNYQMNLENGTSDYTVELPLEEGDYSFIITANERDGGLYRIKGKLRIMDDDVKPPEIQISPVDLSLSDEEAVGGLLVEWNIADYSGISEANVMLNDVEIRSYTNQFAITDSYLLPNDLGAYTFSIWARDNDDDPLHDPPGEDWMENSAETSIAIYDDDVNPPDILISPEDLLITDEAAIGGVLVSWEITDYSGISEANVTLNGMEINSYTDTGTITDSYLLPNEPGVYTFSIWARDNDDDRVDDWLEFSTERTITVFDDDLDPPEIEITPGDLNISVGEADGGVVVSWVITDYSGISEATAFLNGIVIQSYVNLISISGEFLLPNDPGVYNITVWAKDNDQDLEDDWLEFSTMITITIYEDAIPPEGIPGYNVFVLIGFICMGAIIIGKRRKK